MALKPKFTLERVTAVMSLPLKSNLVKVWNHARMEAKVLEKNAMIQDVVKTVAFGANGAHGAVAQMIAVELDLEQENALVKISLNAPAVTKKKKSAMMLAQKS